MAPTIHMDSSGPADVTTAPRAALFVGALGGAAQA